MRTSALARNARSLLVFLYPLVVYVSHTKLSTRTLALLLLLVYGPVTLYAFRAFGTLGHSPWLHIAPLALIALAAVAGEERLLSLQPAFVSLAFLATFTASLRDGPPMYERFGRLFDPELPDVLIPYCRTVTIVWCVFFAANATVVAVLSYAAPLSWWALYTGLLSYVLIGALIAGEAGVRRYRFNR